METLEEIIGQYNREEYDADCRRIAELIKSGVPIKFTKLGTGSDKTIRTEIKAKIVSRIKPTTTQQPPPVEFDPDTSSPLYKEEESHAIEPVTINNQIDAATLNLEPESKELLSCMVEAQLHSQFCETVLSRLAETEAKLEEWKLIAKEYNEGLLVPELKAIKGIRQERTLRLWVEKYTESNRDMFSLIHKSKNQLRGRKVSYLEQHFLMKLLLSPQKIKIGSAIATLKSYARLGSLESPSSRPTLRRWCEDYMRNNPAIWTQARKGSKAVAEEIVKTIKRDNELLKVGQVWVADGHTLAFDIINPKTGKPQRMTMIMVLDWASRYPVGATLAFTEDSQHIQIAFRNAFLNWGGVPKYVYLDNGKAFRSKLFNEKWQDHDLSSDLAGIFPRLGIEVAFAESYNAKAKIIERFFKTFQEQFERFISSFRGASVADKPATLMRNEKWAKKMYEANPPTLEEAMQMIGFFIRKMYGESPHSGLKGKTPWSVYNSVKPPDEQRMEAKRLNFLMMSEKRKTLRNNGIVLNKLMYWDTALMEHIGKEVLIRYDMADLRWIVVYDMQDNYICQAEVRRSQDPFVHLDKSNPISQAELNKECKEIKRYHKQIERRTKLTVRHSSDVVENQLRPLLMTTANPTFIQPPMLEAPKPGHEQEMARLEQMVIHKQVQEIQETPEPTVEMAKLEAEIIPELTNKSQSIKSDVSLKEMLKRIGVERR